MIRVELPAHLRTLARVDGEVTLDVEGPVTQRSVLDALEARYPMLRGTIRDHVTQQRRPVRAVLRLRGGSVARTAGRPAARRGRDGGRAVSGRGGDGRRPCRIETNPPKEILRCSICVAPCHKEKPYWTQEIVNF